IALAAPTRPTASQPNSACPLREVGGPKKPRVVRSPGGRRWVWSLQGGAAPTGFPDPFTFGFDVRQGVFHGTSVPGLDLGAFVLGGRSGRYLGSSASPAERSANHEPNRYRLPDRLHAQRSSSTAASVASSPKRGA